MSEENIEIVRRCYDCVNRRDWDGLWRDVHPDFVLRTQLQGSYQGPEEAVNFIQDGYAGFASWSLALDELIASDDQIAALITSRAQPRGANSEIVIKIGHVWTFQHGKVLALETFPGEKMRSEPPGCGSRLMSEDNAEILRRLFQRWATGDLTADCFDPDIEYLRTGTGNPIMEGRWLGRDEVSTAMRDYIRAFSDLRIEAERIVDLSGDRVLVLSRHTARGKQSGVPIEHEIGDLFTLRNGMIVRYESYWNRGEALKAAGLSE